MADEFIEKEVSRAIDLQRSDVDSLQKSVDRHYQTSLKKFSAEFASHQGEYEESIKIFEEMRTKDQNIKALLDSRRAELASMRDTLSVLNSQRDTVRASILSEKSRLTKMRNFKIFNKSIASLPSLADSLDIPSMISSIKAIRAISQSLNLAKEAEESIQSAATQISKDFSAFLTLTPSALTFGHSDCVAEILSLTNQTGTFLEFAWNLINSTLLPRIYSESSVFRFDPSTVKFELFANPQHTTNICFIKTANNLLRSLLEAFALIRINPLAEQKSDFAQKAHALACKDAVDAEFSDAAKELFQTASASPLPVILVECRQMLSEGKPFGAVVERMKAMTMGSSPEGMLLNLAQLAVVEWKGDNDKLAAAENVLIAIDSKESLECALLFDEAEREGKNVNKG